MAITIDMIESKEFKIIGKGYDPDEVDAFLDSIMDEFEDMQREIQNLRAQARKKSAAPAPSLSTTVVSDTSESAQKLLLNAQRVSDETMAEARRQADDLVNDAKVKSELIIADAKREATRLQDSLSTLRGAAQDYRVRFKRLVEDQMHLLNAETELFE